MSSARAAVEEIVREAAEIASASSPSEVLRLTVRASRHAAPRLALFLVRGGHLQGWISRGHPKAAALRLRLLRLDPAGHWFGRAAESGAAGLVRRGRDEASPDFGQSDAVEACALPVFAGGTAAAVLLAERSREEAPWDTALLKLLALVAGLKLEVAVAERRQRRGEAPAVREAPRPAPAEPRPAPAAPAAETETSLKLVRTEAGVAIAGRSREDDARAFARLVATDIRLYNEEAVILGRRNRDLEARLGDQIERGRDAFRRRFPDLGDRGRSILHEAFVQVLAAGDSTLLSPPD